MWNSLLRHRHSNMNMNVVFNIKRQLVKQPQIQKQTIPNICNTRTIPIQIGTNNVNNMYFNGVRCFSSATTDPSTPVTKKKKKKSRKGTGKPTSLSTIIYRLSPELSNILGRTQSSRTEITKEIWKYIKSNNMQDPNNKRVIICNDVFKTTFKQDQIGIFELPKLLNHHILDRVN